MDPLVLHRIRQEWYVDQADGLPPQQFLILRLWGTGADGQPHYFDLINPRGVLLDGETVHVRTALLAENRAAQITGDLSKIIVRPRSRFALHDDHKRNLARLIWRALHRTTLSGNLMYHHVETARIAGHRGDWPLQALLKTLRVAFLFPWRAPGPRDVPNPFWALNLPVHKLIIRNANGHWAVDYVGEILKPLIPNTTTLTFRGRLHATSRCMTADALQ